MIGTGPPEPRDGAAVDWAEAERRGRRAHWLGVVPTAALFAGIVLLTRRFGLAEGAAAWMVVTVLVGGFLLVALLTRLGAGAAEGYRLQYALRHRVDPGPELRERGDRLADHLLANRWILWALPLGQVGFLLAGRWDHLGTAVPGALLVVGAVATLTVWGRRTVADARRWTADPPGPARVPSPLGLRERWGRGWRLLLLSSGICALVAGVAAGIALATES